MTAHQPRHARQTEPGDIPRILRGLADLIEIVSDEEEQAA